MSCGSNGRIFESRIEVPSIEEDIKTACLQAMRLLVKLR